MDGQSDIVGDGNKINIRGQNLTLIMLRGSAAAAFSFFFEQIEAVRCELSKSMKD